MHNTFTGEEDVRYVRRETKEVRQKTRQVQGELSGDRQTNTFFCLCANANQYIEDVMPPVEMFRKNGCEIVLGTDSLASNWSLSILNEMKTIRRHFPHIALAEMFAWATLNGARALQMDDWLGSFEKGKKPGAVLVNEDMLEIRRVLF